MNLYLSQRGGKGLGCLYLFYLSPVYKCCWRKPLTRAVFMTDCVSVLSLGCMLSFATSWTWKTKVAAASPRSLGTCLSHSVWTGMVLGQSSYWRQPLSCHSLPLITQGSSLNLFWNLLFRTQRRTCRSNGLFTLSKWHSWSNVTYCSSSTHCLAHVFRLLESQKNRVPSIPPKNLPLHCCCLVTAAKSCITSPVISCHTCSLYIFFIAYKS